MAGRAGAVQSDEINELKQMIRDLTIKQSQQVEAVPTPIKKEAIPISQQLISESESEPVKVRRSRKEAVVVKKPSTRRKKPAVYDDTATETEMYSEPIMVRPKKAYRSRVEPTKHPSSTIVRDINDLF